MSNTEDTHARQPSFYRSPSNDYEEGYRDAKKEMDALKLELQKHKELCKTAIALLDNIMSDMKEEGSNQWYTDQIEDLIKQSESLIYKPDEI